MSVAEAIICEDPHISAAVMFGRGRSQNGVLIEPKKEFAFELSDEKVAQFRDLIWFVPSLEFYYQNR